MKPPPSIPAAPLQALLAQIAERELGNLEDPRGSNRGAALAKYFAADGYDPREDGAKEDSGYPWCAAFVTWCVQEWTRQLAALFAAPSRPGMDAGPRSVSGLPKSFRPPRLSAAWDFQAWGQKNGCTVFAPPSPGVLFGTLDQPARGDVVVFTFSHVGIVRTPLSGRQFTTVEGNANPEGGREGYGVFSLQRRFDQARCFVRLPNPV